MELKLTEQEQVTAVENFRAYLRINTMHPDPDYAPAVEWLQLQAKQLGLPTEVIEVHPSKPVVLLTWAGLDPKLKSLMLISHIDVVPVFPEHWHHEPFAADMDAEGNIIARGAQDMKCVGVQYLEAVRKLMANNYKPMRNVILAFLPEEELGGKLGMELFSKSSVFQQLNVGCALDEGLANPTDAFDVYYGERSVWWLRFTANGDPGHGSRLLENTAAEKMCKIIQRIEQFRQSQVQRLQRSKSLELGEVTTLNITQFRGGVQTNVIPEQVTIDVDCRIAPEVDLVTFEAELRAWCSEAGDGVSLEFQQKFDSGPPTDISDTNAWWTAFTNCVSKRLQLRIKPLIFPAATDSRFLRKIGIPAIGFSPMNYTPVLLHDHNEYLNRDIFLKGVDIYVALLPAMIQADTL